PRPALSLAPPPRAGPPPRSPNALSPRHRGPDGSRRVRPRSHRAMAAVLFVAVALAFADTSIVVRALPDRYREFNTSIVGVSSVLICYAAVLAVASLLLAVRG